MSLPGAKVDGRPLDKKKPRTSRGRISYDNQDLPPRLSDRGQCRKETAQPYFNALETELNVALRLLPKVCTAAMIATEMPAAISPYSIAVAPD